MTLPQPVTDTPPGDVGDLVECVGCGVLGRWTGPGRVVNAERHSVPPVCSRRPLRGHGPWVPTDRRP